MKIISKIVEFKKIVNEQDLISFITNILTSENFDDRVFICRTDDGIQLFTNKLYIDTVIVDRIIERLKQHKSAV